MKNFSTLSELVSYQATKFNNPRVLNFKEDGKLRSFSNQQFKEKTFQFACGLKELGLKKGETMANFSYQNPIWLIADLGAILAGAVTVPIFHNISKENLLYEIQDANVKFVFTDSEEFFELIKGANLDLKIITYGFSKENSVSFEELLGLGEKTIAEKKYDFNDLVSQAKPDDLATIIYTSGSTGKPKGVELTHNNLVSQILDTEQFFPFSPSEIALSFLPLAHIFERMVMMYYLTQGITIYFADDVKNVGNLLKEYRPTLMTTVPRLLEKVYGKIKEGIEEASPVKKILGTLACKRALVKNPKSLKNPADKIFDALVYKKFRAALGGRMNMVICGGAALSEDLQRFYNNIGVNLFCGYGLTESSPVLAANCPKANKLGTVGKAFPSVELKIAAGGELMARGPNIMKGYHNHPELTAETIIDGWLKTGDRAVIDGDGFLRIIGRSKEAFKNANGKYVSPVPIEQKLMQELGFLVGAVVIAEGRTFTSALLFPDFENLSKIKSRLTSNQSDEEFLQSENLKKFIEEKISKINRNFDQWEQVKKFAIISKPISIESGEITPSMKMKRNVVEEKFKKEIDALYSDKD